MRVLNVGGNHRNILLPAAFDGWDQLLLDVDPASEADVLCDARELINHVSAGSFDAVYCSHNLEHYYQHDLKKVLAGFQHALSEQGFCYIVVPDLDAVAREMVTRNFDIEDVLYQAPAGPITIADVIFGWRLQVERSGVDFFAHKNGFTKKSLRAALGAANFQAVHISSGPYEIHALAFKLVVDEKILSAFGLTADPPFEANSLQRAFELAQTGQWHAARCVARAVLAANPSVHPLLDIAGLSAYNLGEPDATANY
jgi:SAM-dependent methyltransferase